MIQHKNGDQTDHIIRGIFIAQIVCGLLVLLVSARSFLLYGLFVHLSIALGFCLFVYTISAVGVVLYVLTNYTFSPEQPENSADVVGAPDAVVVGVPDTVVTGTEWALADYTMPNEGVVRPDTQLEYTVFFSPDGEARGTNSCNVFSRLQFSLAALASISSPLSSAPTVGAVQFGETAAQTKKSCPGQTDLVGLLARHKFHMLLTAERGTSWASRELVLLQTPHTGLRLTMIELKRGYISHNSELEGGFYSFGHLDQQFTLVDFDGSKLIGDGPWEVVVAGLSPVPDTVATIPLPAPRATVTAYQTIGE